MWLIPEVIKGWPAPRLRFFIVGIHKIRPEPVEASAPVEAEKDYHAMLGYLGIPWIHVKWDGQFVDKLVNFFHSEQPQPECHQTKPSQVALHVELRLSKEEEP